VEQAAAFAGEVTIEDAHDDFAMLALQGPSARAILREHLEGEEPARMRWTLATVAGVPGVGVCGTGYTGENGVELLIPPDGAPVVWDALVASGAQPAGLGARDTLRLEVCFPLYGNDLSEDRTPLEAGLGWAVKLDTDFIGADALRASGETADRLVPFAFTGPGIPRQGNPILVAGEPAGVVTSGTLSPCLEQGVGMGYVPAAAVAPGTPIEVDVRGRLRAAEVREKPLYRKEDR
jgi:aminomethyltransferase